MINKQKLKLAVIGLGYVGLPLALEFAKKRNLVGFDTNKKRINQLNLGIDKNFTLTNQVFFKENPLFLGEYHQAFRNTNFFADFGYTDGYKKTSSSKRPGAKSHFFFKDCKKL